VEPEGTTKAIGGATPSGSTTWLDILKRALEEPVGLALLCNDRQSADDARQALYAERLAQREAGNTAFDNLTLSIAPHASDVLFLYKGPSGE
jgi:hypothetical protein